LERFILFSSGRTQGNTKLLLFHSLYSRRDRTKMARSDHPEKMRQSGEEADIVEKPQKPVPQSTALEDSTPQSSTSTSTFQGRNLPQIDTSLAPNLRPKANMKDRAQTFQEAINESMQETKLMRESRIGSLEQESQQESRQKVFLNTVNDFRSAASGTFTSIQKWAHSKKLDDIGFSTTKSEDDDDFVAPWPRRPPPSPMKGASETIPKRSVDGEVKPTKRQIRDDSQSVQRQSLLQDLTWPLMACSAEVAESLPGREDFSPHIKKVKETVFRASNGDIKGARDLWKFSAFDKDDDNMSSASYDTLQEENNQIHRLASWNTVNTMATTGTNGTDESVASLGAEEGSPGEGAEEGSPGQIRIDVADDDGNVIDPYLLSMTQQTREKRKPPRRVKVVKFDYPPIKSLRTYPRPNPEDLPELFFTEIELDQIEDDRYSTMSTDDVEIVAVANQAPEHHAEPEAASKFSIYNRSPKSRKGAKFAAGSPSRHSAVDGRDPPDAHWRSSKDRASTPMPRRNVGDNDSEISSGMPPKSPNRLVKGVQIYLRERSTGA
jgi:hypothetical protein